MLESAREKGEEVVSGFRRTFTSYGLADHIGSLINRYEQHITDVDQQLADMNSRVTAARQQRREEESRQERLLRMAEDDDLVLGDELHEMKLGRFALETEKVDQDG